MRGEVRWQKSKVKEEVVEGRTESLVRKRNTGTYKKSPDRSHVYHQEFLQQGRDPGFRGFVHAVYDVGHGWDFAFVALIDEVWGDSRGVGKRNGEWRSRIDYEGEKSSTRKTSVSDKELEARRAMSGMKKSCGRTVSE